MVLFEKAPAKINLTLDVLSKRDDGYHNVVSILQEVELFDLITLRRTAGKMSFRCDNPELRDEKSNLCITTAMEIKNRYRVKYGVDIILRKSIPIRSGLGGGSSDAAATIKGLIQLFKLSVSKKDINRIAVFLGADVPFFLNGITAFGFGIGDFLKPSPPLPLFWFTQIHSTFVHIS